MGNAAAHSFNRFKARIAAQNLDRVSG